MFVLEHCKKQSEFDADSWMASCQSIIVMFCLHFWVPLWNAVISLMLYVPLRSHSKINIQQVMSILFLFCVLEYHLWIPTWSAREEFCLHCIPAKQLKRQTFHAKRDGREREGIVEGNKWKSIVTGSSPVIYGPILILSSCPDHHHHEQSPVNAGKLNIVRRESQKVPLFPKLSPTDNVKRISTTVPDSISVSQQKSALLLFSV